MKQLSVKAFRQACDTTIEEDLDFLLIAGDLFHTAIPSLDLVKAVVRKLQAVKDAGIPTYFIAGSHDFSPTGKTMLDVIEEADLGRNVTQGRINEDGELSLNFTTDPETGVKLTGMIGKKGMLDQQHYDDLQRAPLEAEDGEKIFLFHTAIDQLKPASIPMETNPINIFPEGFDYYAGGHVHIVREANYDDEGYPNVIYPGPLFPTNFSELETLGQGGFYIYDDGDLRREPINLKPVTSVTVNVDDEQPETVHESICERLDEKQVEDSIVTIRIKGNLVGGRTSDIRFDTIHDALLDDGAFYVLKNTISLQTESFKADVDNRTHDDIEAELIDEYSGQVEHVFDDEVSVVHDLLQSLRAEKQDGETNRDYDSRMIDEASSLITSHVEANQDGSSPAQDEQNTGGDGSASLDAFIEES
jgi:DNA repair exonuclease SbcCD nuclease subunit